MSKINDQSLEDLLRVNSHYVMDSLGDTIEFDGKSDEFREEILKVSLKSLEIATILTCKFFDSESFQMDKIATIAKELQQENFDQANHLMAEES